MADSADPKHRQRTVGGLSGLADDARNGIFYQSRWAGMDEDAVMMRASHPVWRLSRLVMVGCLLVAWIAMVVACIALLAQGDSVAECPAVAIPKWFETAVSYQIYPASFQDSNGDGTGDIQGIMSRLDYLDSLGVDAVWLGPVFPSSGMAFGMDVEEFTAVDGVYGTMQDFEELVTLIHSKGMKLILEFIPNQSSDRHTWFQQSKEDPDNTYGDYYIWADGIDGQEPLYTESATNDALSWAYDQTRRQWYMFSSIKEAPELNYRNPNVIRDVQAALRFWLDKGVDGFYLRHAERLIRSLVVQKELSLSGAAGGNDLASSGNGSLVSEARNDTLVVIEGWGQQMDEYDAANATQDSTRFLVVDTGSDLALASMVYNTPHAQRADAPFNSMFLTVESPLSGHQLRAAIETWQATGPTGDTIIWAMGTADVSRLASRCCQRFGRAMLFLMLMLPGSPLIYYGDEIGMTDGQKMNMSTVGADDSMTDMMRSDRELTRSPMQWSPDVHAGFTDASTEPWLPVNQNADTINVELQRQNSSSLLALIEQTIQFRRNNSALFGRKDPELFRFQTTYREVVAFTLEASAGRDGDSTAVFFAVNIAEYEVTESFDSRKERIPLTGVVELASDWTRLGQTVDFSRLLLRSGEVVAIRYKSLDKPDAFSEPYDR